MGFFDSPAVIVQLFGGKSQVVQFQQFHSAGKQPHYDFLAVDGRQRRHPDVEFPAPVVVHDPSVLRQALFGYVHFREDFYPVDQCGVVFFFYHISFDQLAVYPEADAATPLKGFQVDITGPRVESFLNEFG